jgi:hypothetical protein
VLQALHLEQHPHAPWIKADALPIGQAEHAVVVEHCGAVEEKGEGRMTV